MKNRFIKIISIFLIFSMLLSISAFAEDATTPFAEETVTEVESPEDFDTPDTPVEPDNPDEPTEPSTPTFDELPGDTVVARMYICSQIVFLGHSWIYIESCFDGEMTVGCYTMKPYGSVSVGTFLLTRSDGGGLYYNVERYCANEFGLKNQFWLGMDLTKDQLLTVSSNIKNWNYWGLYLNCTFFASKVWNSVSDKFIMPMMFPAFTKAQTKTLGGNPDVIMQDVEPEDCYKQKSFGDDAFLEVVSSGTLDSRLL